MKFAFAFLVLGWLATVSLRGEDFASLCADRAVIEQICYHHRSGDKPPFEQVVPRTVLEDLVRQDLRKEAVLRRNYGIEITDAKVAAEVQRIDHSTQPPALLEEIKAGLGNDPVRFANAVARPILVERLLRQVFDNDDEIHASQRRLAQQVRDELLAAKTNGADSDALVALLSHHGSNAVAEITWRLDLPVVTNPAVPPIVSLPLDGHPAAKVASFTDLPGELQGTLRSQLCRPGDVSTVIETPCNLQVYVARAKTNAVLSVAVLSLPKRGYEEWLREQSEVLP